MKEEQEELECPICKYKGKPSEFRADKAAHDVAADGAIMTSKIIAYKCPKCGYKIE